MVDEKLIVPIIASGLVFLFIGSGFVLFLLYFNQQRNRAKQLQRAKALEYEQQISNTRQEVQKETLNEVGRELHDNIGQLLTVARIQIAESLKKGHSSTLAKAEETVLRAAKDVRDLAHTLNSIAMPEFDVYDAIQADVSRIDRTQELSVSAKLQGSPNDLVDDWQIIIYRIFQESLNNALKHAKASQITVTAMVKQQGFTLSVQDNGVGFNCQNMPNGVGMNNMYQRAELIKAQLEIDSRPNEGCTMKLHVPLNKHV